MTGTGAITAPAATVAGTATAASGSRGGRVVRLAPLPNDDDEVLDLMDFGDF